MDFAALLAGRMRTAQVEPADGKPGIRIVGQLDIGSTIANVVILVPERFEDLKTQPPEVQCSDPWVKQGADWHNLSSLCWIIPNEWSDIMGWEGKPPDDVFTEGVALLLGEVTRLLSYHHYADMQGITEWQAEWPAWSHNDEGVREYEQYRDG